MKYLLILILLFMSCVVYAEDTPIFKKPAISNEAVRPIFILYDDGDSETRYIGATNNFHFFKILENLSIMENAPNSVLKGIIYLFYGLTFTDYKNEIIFDGEKFVKSKEVKKNDNKTH